MHVGLHVKCQPILLQLRNNNLIGSSQLFDVGGQTDMVKLTGMRLWLGADALK
jgi:hypothetical protein